MHVSRFQQSSSPIHIGPVRQFQFQESKRTARLQQLPAQIGRLHRLQLPQGWKRPRPVCCQCAEDHLRGPSCSSTRRWKAGSYIFCPILEAWCYMTESASLCMHRYRMLVVQFVVKAICFRVRRHIDRDRVDLGSRSPHAAAATSPTDSTQCPA